MTLEKLIDTVSAILENDKIEKNGLSLTYLLDPNIHLQINKEIFYKTNVSSATFEPADEFEVEISGVIIKFIKKK